MSARSLTMLRNIRSGVRRQLKVARLFAQVELTGADVTLLGRVLSQSKGTYDRECTICGYSGKFRPFGDPPRWNAECPSCGSLERHRLLALVLRDGLVIPKRARVLHFAPEPCLKNLLEERSSQYMTTALYGDGVDLHLNIESIAIGDAAFDIVICNHVLEHVDDRKALSEMARIITDDGALLLSVPLVEGCHVTYENPSITEERDREAHFGQNDHIRIYGRDFRHRLVEAGLCFEEFTAAGKDAVRFGLLMGEKIFVCRKARASKRVGIVRDGANRDA